AMHPQANGRFCDSCCKVVVDFTNFSDQEIVDYLQAKNKERVCGRFKVDQVKQTPVPEIIQLKDRNKIWKLQQFAAALLLAFGSILFTSCNKHLKGKTRITGDTVLVTESVTVKAMQHNDTVKKKNVKTTCEQPETELKGDVALPEILVGRIAYPQPVVDSVNQEEKIIKGEVIKVEPK
ncbi:MAG: hypothetical protein ACRC3B_02580, partial [Bacteroidia bacterium]